MHMISKKDLGNAEMDTLTKSCSPTIVITANGEVQAHEEAIVYVKELEKFLKVPENTPAVLSLGKLCDENGYSYEWVNGQKTTSHFKRGSDTMQYGKLRSYRGSWFTNKFFLQFSLFNIYDEEHKAQKQDSFLRGRQIAYLIYDHFRVTGTHDSVEHYSDLFTIVLRNDDIQEFDSKWDGILLSMTKIPHDDILEGLYKLRIRESEKLKTVLELFDLEIHQKKIGPDYHRLKTMVKRSFEQDIRGLPERNLHHSIL